MTTKKTFFVLILSAVILVPFTMSAQVTIGSGRAPSEWSLLDLCTDVQRKALHNARMNEEQRDRLMSPNTNYHSLEDQLAARGLLIFHIDAIEPGVGCLEFWNGIKWVSLCENRLPLTQSNPTPATICYGDTHTFTLDAATGGSGTITYQWQNSTDGITWANITNATGQNFTTPALTASTHFRRIAAAAACGSSIESNGALVTVTAAFTQPDFNPRRDWTVQGARYTISLGASTGGSGTLTYQWQSSADGTSGWTDIPGATSQNFTTQPFQANSHRFFRRQAARATCGGTITSNVFELIVVAASNVAAPGAFAANPENTGMLYQWGRRVGWSATDPRTSSPAGQAWNSTGASGEEWLLTNDPCPVGWRVPRRADFDFVRDNNSNMQRLTVNGVLVWRITNSQNTQLTFPIVNQVRRENGSLRSGDAGLIGYWLLRGGRGSDGSLADAYAVYTDSFGRFLALSRQKARGLPVRCVLR